MLLAPLFAAALAAAPLPATPKQPVTDTYGNVKVTDDYRWLENGADLKVKAWSDAQNTHAREYLDALPHAAEIRSRVRTLLTSTSASYFVVVRRGGKLFAIKKQPPKQQPLLVTLDSPDDLKTEHVVLDPNVLNPKGTTAIDFAVPSLDGKRVAISLSEGGSEDGTVHVYDVASAKEVGDVIPRVNGGTAGGSVAWNADGTGFFYTRYPRGQERAPEDMGFFQQIYFHKLGTPTEQDTYELGKEFPRIAETVLETSDDGAWVLAEVANGDGGEFAHYLRGPKGWVQLTRFEDKATHATFGLDGALYLVSRQGASKGKLLRLPLTSPELAKAKVLVPEGKGVIESVLPLRTRVLVSELVGGPSELRAFDLSGKAQGPVKVLPVSSVEGLVRFDADRALFQNQSYLVPPAYYLLDGSAVKKTAMALTAAADYSDTDVVRATAKSKDGTAVPLTLLMKKGLARDGKNPTLLYGYGGFNIAETPSFSSNLRVWIEQGGIYAIANIRGGGEFGEAWHDAGRLTHKQNVFDDFAACAKYLIDQHYTSPAKLALEGGSNGGLLMGAMITQHPELFRAVVSHVGYYDMLRVENSPNGAFNVTEYGTVKTPEQFAALYAYSPYQHVKDGTAYPSILMMTGANDPRVDPMHSRKMIARLQAANSSKNPILLRTSSNSGHGIGSSLDELIAQRSDAWSFLFHELGVAYQPVASSPAK